jgi:hypothetical protein
MCTRSFNKVREHIAVEVPHTSLLNTTVVAFKVLLLANHAPMSAPSPSFKTILELPLYYSWCHQCHQNAFLLIFPFTSGTEKTHWGLDPVNRQGAPVICLVAKNSLTDSVVWAGALSWCKIHELLAKISGRFQLTLSRSLFSTSK